MHTLLPTDKIHRVSFECLLKVHDGKECMDILWESRLSGTLISPPHFEELGRFQPGVPLPLVSASVSALEYV